MSKSEIREEKKCLNCGAEVLNRFCPACGQQNIEPKISIKDLLHDVLHDLTHFDGKFFSTVGLLIRRPGFLSTQFINGKRVSYLHPVRMYVFTSAVFFFLFYAFFVEVPDKKSDIIDTMTKMELFSKLEQVKEFKGRLKLINGFVVKNNSDTLYDLNDISQFNKLKDSITSSDFNKGVDFYLNDSSSLSTGSNFKTEDEYEKYQSTLPASKKDGFFQSYLSKRVIRISSYFKKDAVAASMEQFSNFLHSFPTLLFISLPMLAFVLQVFFFRRKEMGYAVHGIFLLHLYVFAFLALLFYFTVIKLVFYFQRNVPGLFAPIVFFGVLFYGYKAFRNFYGLRRAKTILYYSSFLFFSLLTLLLLFILYILFILIKL